MYNVQCTYDISPSSKAEVDKFHEENCLVKDVGVGTLAVQGSLKNTLISMEFLSQISIRYIVFSH